MVMKGVPKTFLELLWKFISFLPVFFLLLILAIIKAALFGPIAAIIIFVGNSAVIIGLWPAHFIWTYYCVLKTKRLGLSLKILVLVTLPLPLVLWPILGVVGSLIVGIGYGIFIPLIVTFEATGVLLKDKVYHYFVDGSWSTIKGSCTIVVDVIDFCFHSYFSFMDELSDKIPEGEKPINIKLLRLPSCFVVSLLAVPVDVLLITSVVLWKSPSMLFKGWKRLLEDLIGREGPFLESVCVPFAGLAIILWPLAVICGVFAAFFCSFFLGFYAGVIVHQEDSFKMGLAFIVSVVSLFDEYTNDMLYLREGSCLPRPKYRRDMIAGPSIHERRKAFDSDSDIDQKKERVFPQSTKLVSERSSTLKWAIQQLRPMQVWDWLFRSCEVNGRILIQDGLISIKDIEECIVKGKCNKLGIKLPAWCIMQCLLQSAKANSTGLLISDDMELTKVNWPKDKVFEWFIAPLLIIKEQIKGLHLDTNEEVCLRNLIMTCSNERPDDWDNTGFPSEDNVKRAQLQAIIRRLQGIVASMTRIPTFRRRFRNLVKVLYVESIKAGVLENRDGGRSSVSKSTGFVSAGEDAESSKSKDIPNFDDEIAKITENDSIV